MRVKTFKNRLPYIPLSRIAKADPKSVPRKRRPFMSMSPMLNPKVMTGINKGIRNQVGGVVNDIWEKEGGSLRNKFFVLDHTAEVLEKYRRVQENEIFNKVLFDEREKRAFLKKEARKQENLIENYDQRF